MPQMGKTEEDWNGLKFGFLKTVPQPNSFSKLIPASCNFKNNAQVTHLLVSDLWFCHLHVISLLTLSSIAIEGEQLARLNKMNWTAMTQPFMKTMMKGENLFCLQEYRYCSASNKIWFTNILSLHPIIPNSISLSERFSFLTLWSTGHFITSAQKFLV